MKKLKKPVKPAALAAALMMSAAIFSGCSGKNSVQSIADLNGKTIGVQLETVGDAYASDIEGAVVERFTKGADAIQALKQGNLDAVIIDSEPALVYVGNNTDIVILEEAFADEEYAIAMKKGRDDLREKINGALAELTAEGTLDAIKSNWIGEDAAGALCIP